MVTTRQITKQKMLKLFAEGGLDDHENTGDRIYARIWEPDGEGYVVVWCQI